jgi:hypothetical protein
MPVRGYLAYVVSVPLAAACAAAAGCGDDTAQRQLQLAEDCVRISLDTWARGAHAGALEARPNPIEFHDDDWQQGASLEAFDILKTYHDTDGHPRCAVRLSVRHAKKGASQQEVTYQVNTEPRVVIARDPYS